MKMSSLNLIFGTVVDEVVELQENLLPGSTDSDTLLGNVTGHSGVVPDLLDAVYTGDVGGGIGDLYNDVFAPGGIINNLADGHGTGLEGTLGIVGIGEFTG